MAEQYTPTTEEVREDFWATSGQPRRGGAAFAEFDRWLAAHDAQVLRDAADRMNGDIALFAAIELRMETNPSTNADEAQDLSVAWLRAEANRIAGGTSHE